MPGSRAFLSMQYGGLCHHAIACQMSDMAVNACCRLEAIDTRLTGRYYQSGFPYWGDMVERIL